MEARFNHPFSTKQGKNKAGLGAIHGHHSKAFRADVPNLRQHHAPSALSRLDFGI
jgi:hypothetical protein